MKHNHLHCIAFIILFIITLLGTGHTFAFNGPNTDYTLADQKQYIHNEAFDPIDLVNGILCFTKQVLPHEFVNQGPYVVLADEAKCFNGNSASSDDQSAGASNIPNYMEVIADSTRESSSAPLQLAAWIADMVTGEDGQAQLIKFKALIYEGASSDTPYGRFNFVYEFFDIANPSSSAGGGQVKTIDNLAGKIGFTLYDSESRGGGIQSKSASVVMEADRSAGVALTATNQTNMPQFNKAYGLAFNNSNVLIQTASDYASLPYNNGDNSGQCLSRTSFNETVWRYDLFDSTTGEEIALNAGNSFRYDADNNGSFESHGYMSYWGMWTEQANALSSGDSVMAREGQNSVPYTLLTAPGRLIKNTAESMLLAESRGIDFGYHDPTLETSPFNEWLVNYLTIVDDAVGADGFYIVAGVTHSENGQTVTPQAPLQIILGVNQTLYMHSQQLGGSVKYRDGSNLLTFYRQEFMNGSEALLQAGALTLHCFDRCPLGTITAAQLQAVEGINSPFSARANSLLDEKSFSFSTTGGNALTLINTANGEPVIFDPSLTLEAIQTTPHHWGIHSGPMVTANVLATLSGPEDVYDPNLVSVFYVWETGLNHWNQLQVLVNNAGAIKTFDKPIQFSYQHSNDKDRSGNAGTFNGTTLLIGYNGNGDVWGIPADPNASTPGNWRPAFNLADGVIMGPTNQYVIKARELEKSMANAPGQCTSLQITTPATAVPTSVTGSADIGETPTVTAPPVAIGGKLISESAP